MAQPVTLPQQPLLAIETSCDDTCAAVVTPDGHVLSNVISSQARFHERYGGVVPEVASRHHLELVNAVVDDALKTAEVGIGELGRVAATSGPGLIGALLIGLSTAKALAAAAGLPFVPVDHLQGHVAANFLAPDAIEPPFLCLVASGGHTLLAEVEDRPDTGCWGRPATTLPARRSTRRGGCSASASRVAPRSTAWPARATPRPSTFRLGCATVRRSTSASAV